MAAPPPMFDGLAAVVDIDGGILSQGGFAFTFEEPNDVSFERAKEAAKTCARNLKFYSETAELSVHVYSERNSVKRLVMVTQAGVMGQLLAQRAAPPDATFDARFDFQVPIKSKPSAISRDNSMTGTNGTDKSAGGATPRPTAAAAPPFPNALSALKAPSSGSVPNKTPTKEKPFVVIKFLVPATIPDMSVVDLTGLFDFGVCYRPKGGQRSLVRHILMIINVDACLGMNVMRCGAMHVTDDGNAFVCNLGDCRLKGPNDKMHLSTRSTWDISNLVQHGHAVHGFDKLSPDTQTLNGAQQAALNKIPALDLDEYPRDVKCVAMGVPREPEATFELVPTYRPTGDQLPSPSRQDQEVENQDDIEEEVMPDREDTRGKKRPHASSDEDTGAGVKPQRAKKAPATNPHKQPMFEHGRAADTAADTTGAPDLAAEVMDLMKRQDDGAVSDHDADD